MSWFKCSYVLRQQVSNFLVIKEKDLMIYEELRENKPKITQLCLLSDQLVTDLLYFSPLRKLKEQIKRLQRHFSLYEKRNQPHTPSQNKTKIPKQNKTSQQKSLIHQVFTSGQIFIIFFQIFVIDGTCFY